MSIKFFLSAFSQIKVKNIQTNPWFPCLLSFGNYLNLTIPLIGQLVAQSLQRNNNSK